MSAFFAENKNIYILSAYLSGNNKVALLTHFNEKSLTHYKIVSPVISHDL
ncbi:hypothetical protein PROSTU_01505 [Providencia stuartii ATCC 25827]|uniref:Uncharacterized protein n=1 Tax=Providencia stuartii ATCC 25827 TaxID=471874 RepID=A0AA86YTT1_PROST|nr:hypothetical protein PROSTU_01505 [Providencia stuartii ATCC 25827]